jgi:hypothetical protein
MAEAVGLAASVAGLVSLAGQIIKGGLFIREFFEDVSKLSIYAILKYLPSAMGIFELSKTGSVTALFPFQYDACFIYL